MKFKELLREAGSAFKDEAKYSVSDYTAWKKMAAKEKSGYEFDYQGSLELVYNSNGKHIATYDNRRNVIMSSDLKLFGN